MPADDSLELFPAAPDRGRGDTGAPLADRMRPRTLDELVGQEHLVGPGAPLRTLLGSGALPSLILWGPPGTGKTSLAAVIARGTKSHFETINAVMAGVADIRKVGAGAQRRRQVADQRTILLVDEIHRFNRAQQDALLPHVEDGTVILIGATTQNPFFDVNATLQHCLGIDPDRFTYKFQGLDQRLIGVEGAQPIKALLA